MKQFSNARAGNRKGQTEIGASYGLGVKLHDQRMRLWAARSMAFP